MTIKTNKQISEELDKILKINNCGLSFRSLKANILLDLEIVNNFSQDNFEELWSKKTKLK